MDSVLLVILRLSYQHKPWMRAASDTEVGSAQEPWLRGNGVF